MSKWRRCSVKDCVRPAKARGLCDAHYGRLMRTWRGLRPELPVRSLATKRFLEKR